MHSPHPAQGLSDDAGVEPVIRRSLVAQPGQALVEYAIVLPVFLLLTLCVVDFSRAIWAYNTVAYLARDGARFGTIPSRSTAAIQTYVGTRCASMLNDPCPAPPAVTFSVTRGTCGDPAASVVVTVRDRFQPITASLWGGGPVDLEATSQMFVEQGPPGGCAA
jgi:Flp pilus assembly protein TadG